MNELLKLIEDDFFNGFYNYPEVRRVHYRGRVYNPDTHDIVPKPEYLAEEIKKIDDEIKRLSEAKETLQKKKSLKSG